MVCASMLRFRAQLHSIEHASRLWARQTVLLKALAQSRSQSRRDDWPGGPILRRLLEAEQKFRTNARLPGHDLRVTGSRLSAFRRARSTLSVCQSEPAFFGLFFGGEKLDTDFIAGNAHQLAAPISKPGRGKQQEKFLKVQSFE